MSTDSYGKLVYAHQKWDPGFHYLNWSCERMSSESESDYRSKRYELAFECIERARIVSEKLGQPCFVVFVTRRIKLAGEEYPAQ